MTPKDLRKQIKNVLQETGKDFLISDLGEILEKKVTEAMHARLDQIDKYCQEALDKQDKRAKAIQSFIVQQVQGKIQEDLFNANCTIDAVVEVLAEAGLNIPDFSKKIDEKKVIIAEKVRREADERMQAQMKERVEAAKTQQEAAASAPQEVKAEQQA